jgi:hypothetical protein
MTIEIDMKRGKRTGIAIKMQLVSSSLFQIKTVAVDPKLSLCLTSSRQSFIVIIDERVQPEDAARSFHRKSSLLK